MHLELGKQYGDIVDVTNIRPTAPQKRIKNVINYLSKTMLSITGNNMSYSTLQALLGLVMKVTHRKHMRTFNGDLSTIRKQLKADYLQKQKQAA